jgi:hypothetical protein
LFVKSLTLGLRADDAALIQKRSLTALSPDQIRPNIDREKGIEELRQTAYHGYYLEPFAKLLMAVAALRDGNPSGARDILAELHRRFPDNELYTQELNRVELTVH